jgi:membrane protein
MTAWKFSKEIVGGFFEDGCLRMGAALAYYTVFALAPIIIIIMMVTGVFFADQTVNEQIYSQINGMIGNAGVAQVRQMVEATRQQQSSQLATIISVLSLVFAASGVFYSIKDALNTIWKVKAVPKSGIAKFALDRLRSLAIVLSIGFIMLVSLVLDGLIAGLASYLGNVMPTITVYLVKGLNVAVSILIASALFAIILKSLPDAETRWSDACVGAVFTALLFTLGKWAIGLYIGRADIGSTYGAAGAIVIILLWVYYVSQILFLGAEFTFVYARRYGAGIRPSQHAVRVVQREVEVDDEGHRIRTADNHST